MRGIVQITLLLQAHHPHSLTMVTSEKSSTKTQEQEEHVRPIPDEETWRMIHEAYKTVKGTTDPDDEFLYQAIDAKDNGFKIPFKVRQSPGKGRGIFCTEFVPKGVCVCQDRSGRFYTEKQWREFLSLLPHDLAKDCVDWAYCEEHKGVKAVHLDLCEAALTNHGKPQHSRWAKLRCFSKSGERANLKEKLIDDKWCYVAARDLEAGEELLCDYEDFHDYDDPLPWFDSIWDDFFPDAASDFSY